LIIKAGIIVTELLDEEEIIRQVTQMARKRGYAAFENFPVADRALIIMEPYEWFVFCAFRTGDRVRFFADSDHTRDEYFDSAERFRRLRGWNHSINSTTRQIEESASLEAFLQWQINVHPCFELREQEFAWEAAGLLTRVNHDWPIFSRVEGVGLHQERVVAEMDEYLRGLFWEHLGVNFDDLVPPQNAPAIPSRTILENPQAGDMLEIYSGGQPLTRIADLKLRPLTAGSPHAKTKANRTIEP
jgi:hypothetical protein